MDDAQILTVRELARYLKLKERTIYRMVASNSILAAKGVSGLL